QTVRDPERQAIDDGEVVGGGEPATRGDHVERLLDGGPAPWPLGAVPRDARSQVGVEPLRGGEKGGGSPRVRAQRQRAQALAASGAAQDELGTMRGRHPDPPAKTGWESRCPGRSPGSRIVLLPTPSRLRRLRASG